MEFPAELQRLPDGPGAGHHSQLRRPPARPDALGVGARLVVEAAQGVEAGDIQCACRDRTEEAVLPGRFQAIALPYSGIGLLRVALLQSRRQEREAAALLLHAAR